MQLKQHHLDNWYLKTLWYEKVYNVNKKKEKKKTSCGLINKGQGKSTFSLQRLWSLCNGEV